MYILYSILLFFLLLIYLPSYLIKYKSRYKNNLHLKERTGWGLFPFKNKHKSIWIHAVSVGEVLALQNLIHKIKQKHPQWRVHFSTLTPSGMEVARQKILDADNIFFVPLDFRLVVRRFFKLLKPDIFILSESEFWPNLLKEAHKHTQGVLLVNGRISNQSFPRYSKFKFLVRKILKNIDYFMVQTPLDKERLGKIGITPTKVEVSGNLKAEINPPQKTAKEISGLKKKLHIPERKKVILAGSTREGEEEKLIQAFIRAKKKSNNILLIIAPRHPQRIEKVEKLLRKYSLYPAKRTSISSSWEVMILDTLGELASFYALCDIAFVGGSLIPWGGHNLLEPAFYKKPIFFGPYMENFAFLAQKFVSSGAAKIVSTTEELEEMFLPSEKKELENMGFQAQKTLKSLQGATDRILAVLESYTRED